VRDGRRREFAAFAGFHDGETAETIPDPNALATFESSRPVAEDADRRALYAGCWRCAPPALVPHLAGAHRSRRRPAGPACVAARWRLGNGAVLALVSNLGRDDCAVDPPKGDLLFETRAGASEDVAPAGSRDRRPSPSWSRQDG
jgi:hypothetical protein